MENALLEMLAAPETRGVMIPVILILVVIGVYLQWRRQESQRLLNDASEDHVITDSAIAVVNLMKEELDALDVRVANVEESLCAMEEWADKVLTLLDKAIMLIPETHQADMKYRAAEVRKQRPQRIINHRKRRPKGTST